MSETNFTPGPWAAQDYPERGGYKILAKQGPIQVCPATAHGLFDARLIAAAPDLYEALYAAETVMLIVEPRSDKAEYLEALRKASAALAKARGEQP